MKSLLSRITTSNYCCCRALRSTQNKIGIFCDYFQVSDAFIFESFVSTTPYYRADLAARTAVTTELRAFKVAIMLVLHDYSDPNKQWAALALCAEVAESVERGG